MNRIDPAGALITVLMPIHNGERFLEEQIESILHQSVERLHLVLLDDASTDHSRSIARRITNRDNRVRLLTNGHNLGLMGSVDRLLSLVATPYFAMADQDDVWDSTKLEESVNLLVSSGAGLVYSNVRVCDIAGRTIVDDYLAASRIAPFDGDDPLAPIFRNPVIGHTIVATAATARNAANVPGYLTYYEPWLCAAARDVGGVRYLNRVLGSYRAHDANLVGPARPPRHWLHSPQRSAERVASRQRTRLLACRALANFDPDCEALARHLAATGWERLPASLQVGAILRRRASTLGYAEVVKESLLALLARSGDSPVRGSGKGGLA